MLIYELPERPIGEKINEKVTAIVFRSALKRRKQVEDFLDSIGATVIFVKETDVNRKLVVKNLPAWGDEKNGDSTTS